MLAIFDFHIICDIIVSVGNKSYLLLLLLFFVAVVLDFFVFVFISLLVFASDIPVIGNRIRPRTLVQTQ